MIQALISVSAPTAFRGADIPPCIKSWRGLRPRTIACSGWLSATASTTISAGYISETVTEADQDTGHEVRLTGMFPARCIEAFKAPIARTICSGAVLSSAAIAKNRATPISTQVMCYLPAKLLRPKAVQIVNRPGPPDDRAGRPRSSSKLGWVAGSACRTDLGQTRPLRWSLRGPTFSIRSRRQPAASRDRFQRQPPAARPIDGGPHRPCHRSVPSSRTILGLTKSRRTLVPGVKRACPRGSGGRGAEYPSGFGPSDDEIDLAAAALAAHQPLVPVRDGHLGAVTLGHCGRVGLDLVPAIAAPHDQVGAGSGGAAECRRRPGVAVHRRRRCWRGADPIGAISGARPVLEAPGPAPDHIETWEARSWLTITIHPIRHFRGYNRSRQPGAWSRSTTPTGWGRCRVPA
jgi:hypothetical protein